MYGSLVRIQHGSPGPGSVSSVRPHRLAWPRTLPFHGSDGGSNPPGDAILTCDSQKAEIQPTLSLGFLSLGAQKSVMIVAI